LDGVTNFQLLYLKPSATKSLDFNDAPRIVDDISGPDSASRCQA